MIRMATGAGRQVAAQHSHSLEGWYAHIPGLKLLAPATVEDARGMLAPALVDPDPVLIFEHALALQHRGRARRGRGRGRHRTRGDPPAGDDVTLIAYGGTLPTALDAADELAAAGDRRRGAQKRPPILRDLCSPPTTAMPEHRPGRRSPDPRWALQ